MPPGASASGLPDKPEFHAALQGLGIDPPAVVRYRGRIRDTLAAWAAPARRQGIEVDFVQAYQHGKLCRFLLVEDPSLPPQMRHQVVAVPGTQDWKTALVTAGLLTEARAKPAPPGAYIECPSCMEAGEVLDFCPECAGKGLVPSPDDS